MNHSVMQEVEAQTTVFGIKKVVSKAFQMMFFSWPEKEQAEEVMVEEEEEEEDTNDNINIVGTDIAVVKQNSKKSNNQKEQERNIEKKMYAKKYYTKQEKKRATNWALEKKAITDAAKKSILLAIDLEIGNISQEKHIVFEKPTKMERKMKEKRRNADRRSKLALLI